MGCAASGLKSQDAGTVCTGVLFSLYQYNFPVGGGGGEGEPTEYELKLML